MQAATLEKSKTSGLQDPVKPCLALSLLFGGAVEVSSSMRAGETVVRQDDIVFLDGVPVCVSACAQQGEDLYVIGGAYELDEKLSRTCSIWRPTDGHVDGRPKMGFETWAAQRFSVRPPGDCSTFWLDPR